MTQLPTQNTVKTSAQSAPEQVIFYHSPFSRSGGVLWLLEELGVDYQTRLVDFRTTGTAPESYRQIQPHKKVPAIQHRGVIVTERAAICTYLADAFPAAGLAPALDNPARGPYLSALVYCDSVVDPCIAARYLGFEYQASGVSFGGFEDMVQNLERQLTRQPYLAGEQFTAADTQLGSGLLWTIQMKMFPDKPVFQDYLARLSERPAFKRWQELDNSPAASAFSEAVLQNA